jgi:hypothetical protein
MLSSSLRLFISRLIVLLMLSACVPSIAQSTDPGTEEMQAQISTSVALTVAAYKTEQAAQVSSTPSPTETPTITITPTLSFPTLTILPSPTHYTGGGAAPTPSPYSCSVVNKIPADNTTFKPNKDFDIKFWLRNVGSKQWGKGADLLYQSGTNMLTTTVTYELSEVDPGEMIGPFVFDAKTPKKAGTYVMNFKVQGGFCYPYIRIIVRS